ncbi:MAG: tRNA 2-selenouridine(34) synthase MnmH [Casimicrobiaceae bacterium]
MAAAAADAGEAALMRFARNVAGVADVARFADRLDVRSPSEFALDHVPRALNAPVLDDSERTRIGTLHAQVSGFAARRAGAALVSRNIAHIIDTLAHDKPLDWAPLVYCWRGGQRSRALAHVLGEIGFGAVQLEGGYRAWRRHVLENLATLPQSVRIVVVCGLTGSGKSRLIAALHAAGAQVLDLEGLANHRGSLLGDAPEGPQPSQKHFETTIYDVLSTCDRGRPLFVESESKRIGRLQIPEMLLATMRTAPCIRIDTALPLRVEILLEDYAHFRRAPGLLNERVAPLAILHGKQTIERWQQASSAGEFASLAEELLTLHYDPSYARSIDRNFVRLASADSIAPRSAHPAAFAVLAQQAIAAADRLTQTSE